MKNMKRIHISLMIILLSIFFACATNPVTGEKELMLVSTEEEKAIGKQTDQEVIAQYGLYPDEKLQNYLSEVGQKIVPYTHRPDLGYEFKVVDSEVVNAFAVPGGYVYFTRGIFAYLNDEAQLAGVLGHEIGHIAARHSAKQITRAQLAQFGLGLGSILSDTFRKYADLAGFGVQMLFLKFSRDNERQADDLGVEYATKAGYNTQKMADFFNTLDRMSPGDEGGLPGWFSTHPNPEDRVEAVHAKTLTWQKQVIQKNFAINRERYLQTIDGIVFGQNPRNGFVKNLIFYHPELRFQFPVPENWNIQNTASQVQMGPKSEDALLLFMLAKKNDPKSAAADFVSESGAVVSKNIATTINGMPAQQVQSEIESDNGNMVVLSTFIQKGNQVYVFHGVTAPNNFSKYQGIFSHSMSNFNNLNDKSILNVKPDRIKLERVRSSGSLKNALTTFGIQPDQQEKVAILNGMYLDDSVAAGTLIKTIEKNY